MSAVIQTDQTNQVPTDPIIIVGSGLAGYTFAREFRKADKQTPLLMITASDGRNYSKPMLSTGFSKGKDDQGLAMALPGDMSEQLNMEIRTHTSVTAIDAETNTINLGKETLTYSKLVLATGASAIQLPQLNDSDRVFSVNDLEDYAEFYRAAQGKKKILVIGAGLVGCEYAHDLASAGYQVTVMAKSSHIFPELLPEQAADSLADELTKQLGIEWVMNQSVDAALDNDQGVEVTLSDGETRQFDLVLSAVGLRANTHLAQSADLEVNQAIVANRQLRTSKPDIYAIGDCAEVNGHHLLYILPLMASARTLAHILSGNDVLLNYPAMPVTVKTPSHPVVIAIPKDEGAWILEEQAGNSVKMLYKSTDGRLLGYVLTGQFVGEKLALNKELPVLF